jgi:hypothetical protein
MIILIKNVALLENRKGAKFFFDNIFKAQENQRFSANV